MATRGALGGLAEAALQAALLMDAAGKDDVFLETVGVGQAEVDVIDHADSVVLVLIPGSGDSIQALKAGVMEIPDVIVVNKSDHPLTDTMVREIRGVLSLAPQGDWRGADRQDRGAPRRGRRAAGGEARRAPRYVESEGLLAERRRRNLMNEVLGLGDGAAATRSRGVAGRGPRGAGAARPGRRAPARPGQRGERDPRARRGRGGRRRATGSAGRSGAVAQRTASGRRARHHSRATTATAAAASAAAAIANHADPTPARGSARTSGP